MPKDVIPNIDEDVKDVVENEEDRTFIVKPGINTKALDTFFRFVLTNELPAGVTAGTTGKEMGINNNILKNLAVWLHEKGFDEEKLKSEIKPTYDRKGWAFGDLLGWFKKVVNGDIKDINKGELYNWCKVYAPELTVLLHLDKTDLIELDFGGDDEERDFALNSVKENEQYNVVKQFLKDFDKYAYRQEFSGLMTFHVILGQMIKEVYIHKEKKTNGNGHTQLMHPLDLRINLFLMRPSGTGKSVGLDFFNNVVSQMSLTSRQPTDFTDSGLIGFIEKIKQETIITFGIFKDSDFITFDEAEILFEKSPHKEGALRRFNVALNTLNQPSQKIFKRMRYGNIEYNPHFSTYFVSVPFFGFEEKIKSGFPQRHLIYIEDEAIQERIRSLKEDISRISFATSPAKREEVKDMGFQRYRYWREIFENLKKFATETQFEQDDSIRNYIQQKILPLYKLTSKINNTEIQGIMFSFLARYLDHLYRLIFHSAVIRQSKIIEKIDVDFAYSIIKKTYMSILYYTEVNTKVMQDNMQDKILAYVYTLLPVDNPRMRAGDLIKTIQKQFRKSQATVYKIIGQYVEKKLLLKEDHTKGGKERVVYYRRPYTQ